METSTRKKGILYISLLVSLFYNCQPDKLSFPDDIQINVTGEILPDSIRLMNFGQSEVHMVKEGNPYKFNLNQSLNDVFNIDVFVDGKSYWRQIYLDGENVLINCNLVDGKFTIDSVYGSAVYNSFVKYAKNISKMLKDKTSDSIVNKYLIGQINENLNSPLSFLMSDQYISINQNNIENIASLKELLNKQQDSLKEHPLSMHGKIDGILDFTALDLASKEFLDIDNKLSKLNLEHKGDYLLDFWFVKCPPCVKDHKAIYDDYDFLDTYNTELIGISIDDNHDEWKNYLDSHGYTWQNYREARKKDDFTKLMDIWAFPTYILVSNSGEIKARFNSFEDIKAYFKG